MDDTTPLIGHIAPDAELVDRFLAGESDAHETRVIRAWASSTPDGDNIADVVRMSIRSSDSDRDDPGMMRDALWAQLKLGAYTPLAAVSPSLRWVRYAVLGMACLVIALVGGRLMQSNTSSGQVVQSYTTAVGQMADLQIGGGNRVVLAPKSTLTIVREPSGGSRVATLEGEARFEIVPDPSVPFEVRTGNVVTRVLGTTFEVRRYPTDTAGRITVLSGRVSSSAIGYDSRVTLTAGMTAQFTESVILSSVTRTAGNYIDWERASLVFQDAPIRSVLQELRLWYGYEFKMLDTINRREHFTATFPVNDQREMLRLLSRVLGMNTTIRDLTVELSPIRVHSTPQSKRDTE